jgi:hypothetical protein
VSATRVAPTCREPPDLGPANVVQKVASALAAHPINAMLNYCYVVEAGRLAKAPAAQGLALPIGYLHSDKKGRNSLVWDAIEPLRPAIDAKVFAFVETHEFARRDFPQSGYNVYRLSRDVTQLLLHQASLPPRDIEEAADWMVTTIMRCASAAQAKVEAAGRKRGRPPRDALSQTASLDL